MRYIVKPMPRRIMPSLATDAPMVWGIAKVPENKWVAGPYTSVADALDACHNMEVKHVG